MSEWRNKSKEGWTRVVNGKREHKTDFEMVEEIGLDEFDKLIAADQEKKKGPTHKPGGMTRGEIQAKAIELGLKGNQKTSVLIKLIEKAEAK